VLLNSRAARGSGSNRYGQKTSGSDYNTQIKLVDNLIDEAGDVESVSNTPKKTNSQVIPLAVHKAMAKTRFPFFWLEADGADAEVLDIIMSGFYDLVEKSDLIDAYENKSGGMKRAYEVGDSLLKFQINSLTDLPHFGTEDFLKFFPTEFATEMRTASGERSVNKCVMSFTYSWDEAVQIYFDQDFKTKATGGRIESIADIEKNAYTAEQLSVMDERVCEVALGIDITDRKNPIQQIFAGVTSAPIEIKKGAEDEGNTQRFPWWKGRGESREPYIPLIHLRCITKSKGFTNNGFGQLFYKTALAERMNKNSGLVYMQNNINAKHVLQVGNIDASEWNKHSQIADQFIARGKQGVIPISDAQDQRISLTTLRSEPLTGEFERSTNVIDRDIARWFNIDSNITDSTKTLGALELEEESQDLILREIAKNNVSEIKFALELIINYLENDADTGDKRKLRVSTKVNGKEIETFGMGTLTIGQMAEFFQKHEVTVRVQGETGVKSSDTLRKARMNAEINRLMALNPQHPAIPRLIKESAAMSGINLNEAETEASIGQAPQAQQGQAPQELPMPNEQAL